MPFPKEPLLAAFYKALSAVAVRIIPKSKEEKKALESNDPEAAGAALSYLQGAYNSATTFIGKAALLKRMVHIAYAVPQYIPVVYNYLASLETYYNGYDRARSYLRRIIPMPNCKWIIEKIFGWKSDLGVTIDMQPQKRPDTIPGTPPRDPGKPKL